MEGLYVLWKTSIYRVLWLDLKGSFCNSVEVLCQIVGLNICICDTNSRWLLPKSSRPQPIPCRVCLGDRITTAGCILLSWTWRFREVTVLATGCQQCELPATPSEFYSWGMIWVTAIFFKIDLISIASSQQNVSLNLAYQAWLRKPCGSCFSLRFLVSSLLQPGEFCQLSQIAHEKKIKKKIYD